MAFHWIGHDINHILPKNWNEEIRSVASKFTTIKELPRTPITSREPAEYSTLKRGRVSGEVVARELPWLFNAYHTTFLELVAKHANEPISCASDIRYGVVLNVAIGKMRFECHVDSNPVEGILFCTSQPPGSGGELRTH